MTNDMDTELQCTQERRPCHLSRNAGQSPPTGLTQFHQVSPSQYSIAHTKASNNNTVSTKSIDTHPTHLK